MIKIHKANSLKKSQKFKVNPDLIAKIFADT